MMVPRFLLAAITASALSVGVLSMANAQAVPGEDTLSDSMISLSTTGPLETELIGLPDLFIAADPGAPVQFEAPVPPGEAPALSSPRISSLPGGCPMPPGMGCPMPGMGSRMSGWGGPPFMRGPLSALQGENALTDDQCEKLYALRSQFLDQTGPKMLQFKSASRQLKDALTSADIDTKRVKDLQSQIASLKADMSNAVTNNLLAGAQVLTAGQRKAIHQAMVRSNLGCCGGQGTFHQWHHPPFPPGAHHDGPDHDH